MRVLIAGAGGLIGGALARHFSATDETFPLLHRQLDLADERQIEAAIATIAPDLIINASAIGVDECERDPQHARIVNVDGPARMAREASKIGAALLHFSTNYVFSGERPDGGFYLPDDEPAPLNVYGRTKVEGERLVRSLCERSWIIRTSWVFGRGKESFLATLPGKLRRGERVTAITDTFASVTWVDDLVQQIARLVPLYEFGIYHLNNSGVCSYAEFADATATLLGLTDSQRTELIGHQSSVTVVRHAPRPRWTPMACDRSERIGLSSMRPWRVALAAFVLKGEITSTA
jgi:dTDP-4-dehydrorhamnose reductase